MNDTSRAALDALTLLGIPRIGLREWHKRVRACGSARAALRDLGDVATRAQAEAAAGHVLARAEALGARVLVHGYDDYPAALVDLTECDANDIAQGNYGQNYSALTSARKALVDAVLNNIMSYHGDRFHMTSDQLDRWTDAANSSRDNVVTGYTKFVDRTANPAFPFGTSGLPYRTVASGVSAARAAGGDIVLVRPGNYAETMTISKPLCLRATRGTAVIGK